MSSFNVLIIDDASLIRDLVKKSVRTQFPNWTVFEAVNGKKAQSLLKQQVMDLVLCDWEMPEMSGTELLSWVREQEHYKNLPFVMVTSRGDRDHVVQAVQAGVSEYLMKPFNNEQLLTKIVKALSKHGVKPSAALAAKPRLSTGSGFGSADTLTSAFAKPTTNQASEDSRPAPPTALSKTTIPVRFASGVAAQCGAKKLNLNEFVGIMERGDKLPQLLEQAVVDIDGGNGKDVARINGYVHTLSAAESSMDSARINVLIRFVDQDPVKMEQLTYFIASKT
ncbi:MAG: response regulator [Gammaproteobacteria bacterium]|nr:response regulator [Gammaproteobacteria bacterium]